MSARKILAKFARDPLGALAGFAGRGHAPIFGACLRFHYVDEPHLAQRLLLAKELRHDPMVYEQLRPITGRRGMVQLAGGESRDLRQRLMPLLGNDGLKILETIVADELGRLMRAWERHSSVALTEAVYGLTWRINYRFISGDDRLKYSDELFDAFRVIGRICGLRMREVVPTPRWLPTGDNRRLAEARRRVDRLLGETVRTRQGDRLSVLSLLPEGSLALDQMTTLIWAGHETTACGIISAMHHLSQDTALQSLVAGNRKQATRVFKEAIRLHPPAYMLARRVERDVEVDGIAFRRGDHVIISLFNMQRRPDLFPDPERFDPRRFDAKAYPLGFLPFGLGAKRCFGEPISYFEASKVLADVTSRFVLSPGARPLAFATDVTLVPSHDYELRLSPRRAEAFGS